jgi:ribosomal-protein-alanine N-acetyltransferase
MIRPFSYDDLDCILKIEKTSFPKSPYDWGTFMDLYSLCPDTFLVYCDTPHDRKQSQIGGYIIFSTEGHIISIAVHPKNRRNGIGKKLLERALIAPPIQGIWAEVRKSNQGAQAFYRKMGFQVTGAISNYYGDEDALIIRWTPKLH